MALDCLTLKPIFHQNAKPFMLGPHVGDDPQLEHFVLGIPTCCYLKKKPQTQREPSCTADTHGPNVRPNANGRIWLLWVPLTLGFVLVMSISSCLCKFSLLWVVKANTTSGVIWALESTGQHEHFLKLTCDTGHARWMLNIYSDMGYGRLLNSTYGIGENKRWRHEILSFLNRHATLGTPHQWPQQ